MFRIGQIVKHRDWDRHNEPNYYTFRIKKIRTTWSDVVYDGELLLNGKLSEIRTFKFNDNWIIVKDVHKTHLPDFL